MCIRDSYLFVLAILLIACVIRKASEEATVNNFQGEGLPGISGDVI